ncbi:DNA-(apurinic or apyrimidinic site) endonuclease isoform X1 [Macrosteles quadrilineatus]|uniref:DNA-(apurinic or apyrimidinic site) endonuclease isoform X1 n=1 Tax=Macrosteles quadrilineatus TaxID=74068 RepID=UPI0023E0943A|nr:DNA-(apurinic or apyrimidinic site) endonuclease isoform X1 [Macrosteles quadrilineatus]
MLPGDAKESKDTETAVKSNEHELSEGEGEADVKDQAEKSDKKKSTLDSWVKKSEKEPKSRGKRSRKEDDSGDKESASKKTKALTPVEESVEGFDFNACEKTTPDGKEWNFKISSWNVAGLRAWVKKGGHHYISREQPDILTLQETKCPESKLPPEVKIDGYHAYWLGSEKDGYAGVSLYTKQKPLDIKYGIGDKTFDKEGRLITAEYEKFYLVATYVVNAGQGLKTLDRKLEWNKQFEKYLKELDAKKPVILTGDLNVAHKEIDLKNPKTNQKSAGFTPQEREDMTKLLEQGFVDTFRHLYPEKEGAYTFWSFMGNARSKNTGWRLDYFIVSERLLPNVCDSVIREKVLGSDHCPVTLFLYI